MARTETYTISNADYYAILSISSNASPSEVKAAYHRALLVYHPDKQHGRPTQETALKRFLEVQKAYESALPFCPPANPP